MIVVDVLSVVRKVLLCFVGMESGRISRDYI